MQIGEKIKQLRKEKGYSQEKLAELLGVSRQAVTKWETDSGIPDIENLITLSKIFEISVDELLSLKNVSKEQGGNLYGSFTEYDIDAAKHYDFHLGCAKSIIITSADSEKLKVELIANTIPTIHEDFNLKIDDNKSRIDLDLFLKNGMTESRARENLEIYVYLPKNLILSFEIAANTEKIELRDIKCDGIELDIKANKAVISNMESKIELDCNLNMEIVCESLEASLDVNQLSACSKLYLSEDTDFSVAAKGRSNKIVFENDLDFSKENSEKIIELNGRKSELTICKLIK